MRDGVGVCFVPDSAPQQPMRVMTQLLLLLLLTNSGNLQFCLSPNLRLSSRLKPLNPSGTQSGTVVGLVAHSGQQ